MLKVLFCIVTTVSLAKCSDFLFSRIKRDAKSLISQAISDYYYPENFYVSTLGYTPSDDFDCSASGYSGGFQLANIIGKAQINDVYACASVCYHRADCVAINFVKSIKECYFLSRATTNKDDLWFNMEINSDFYYFKNCANKLVLSPSSPYAGFSLDGCGKPYFQPKPEGRTRIVGGTDAIPGSHPWIVRLFFNFGDGSGFLCGASLIEKDVLVTAAHCVLDENGDLQPAEKYTAYLGDYNVQYKEQNEKRIGIKKIVPHPDYNTDTNHNDIAIIKLNSPVQYYNNFIRPVCLPNPGQNPSNPQTGCYLAGWGRISNSNKTTAIKLQQARVPIVDDATCASQDIWPHSFDRETMMCAGALDGRANACNGDSGGPLVCLENNGRYTLFGAVSFGSAAACAKINKPAVYARVSNYRTWIDSTMKKL